MKCMKCFQNSASLERVNPVGEKGIYWCEYCVSGKARPERKPSVFDKFSTYKKRQQHQLEMWVKGESLHNDVDFECCPDFSCCNPSMKADEETRKIFFNSCDDIRGQFLMKFLGNAIASITDKKIHIADGKTEIDNIINEN